MGHKSIKEAAAFATNANGKRPLPDFELPDEIINCDMSDMGGSFFDDDDDIDDDEDDGSENYKDEVSFKLLVLKGAHSKKSELEWIVENPDGLPTVAPFDHDSNPRLPSYASHFVFLTKLMKTSEWSGWAFHSIFGDQDLKAGAVAVVFMEKVN